MPFENSKIVWNWMVGIVGDRLILCRTFLATRTSSVQLCVIAYNDLISKLMVVTDCVYKQCNSQSEAVHTHNSAFSHVVCESSSHRRDLAGRLVDAASLVYDAINLSPWRSLPVKGNLKEHIPPLVRQVDWVNESPSVCLRDLLTCVKIVLKARCNMVCVGGGGQWTTVARAYIPETQWCYTFCLERTARCRQWMYDSTCRWLTVIVR